MAHKSQEKCLHWHRLISIGAEQYVDSGSPDQFTLSLHATPEGSQIRFRLGNSVFAKMWSNISLVPSLREKSISLIFLDQYAIIS